MNNSHEQRLRLTLAQEAARIMLDEGVEDYQGAKRKAAYRLGAGTRQALPRNIEIERAIEEHRRMFFTDGYDDHLIGLRKAALASMRMLQAFRPRLVGAVLKGTAGWHSDVKLHVFADAVEDVLFELMDTGIAYRSSERRVRYADETYAYPALRFAMQDMEIEALVFPAAGVRQAPSSATDGKPMRRATLAEVERLLAEASVDSQ